MSTTTKVLILTWVAIGFLVVGAAGFYLGRVTAPKTQASLGGQQPGSQQPPQGGQTMPQGSGVPQQGPSQGGSGSQQGGQQNPPAGGGQLPAQR